MKIKLQILTVAVAICAGSLSAQDIIVKRDGSIIKGKITEIGETDIKYKKAENPDGPLYTISTNNISTINYENGRVEKFGDATESSGSSESSESGSESESSGKGGSILDNEDMKRTIEATAKDVGEQLVRNCSNGKVDNSTTEIYWDGVIKDAFTEEICIPIIAKWKPKFNEGTGKWIKGKILIDKSGNKKWVYQNNGGMLFADCAKTFRPR